MTAFLKITPSPCGQSRHPTWNADAVRIVHLSHAESRHPRVLSLCPKPDVSRGFVDHFRPRFILREPESLGLWTVGLAGCSRIRATVARPYVLLTAAGRPSERTSWPCQHDKPSTLQLAMPGPISQPSQSLAGYDKERPSLHFPEVDNLAIAYRACPQHRFSMGYCGSRIAFVASARGGVFDVHRLIPHRYTVP